jgi:hypothetical protein
MQSLAAPESPNLAPHAAGLPEAEAALAQAIASRYGFDRIQGLHTGMNYACLLKGPERAAVLKLPGTSGDTRGLIGASREIDAFELFAEHEPPPFPIPKLIESDRTTGLRLFTLLPGFSANWDAFNWYSHVRGPAIGEAIGQHLAWLSRIDPVVFADRVIDPHFQWDGLIDPARETFHDPRYPSLMHALTQLRQEFAGYYPEGNMRSADLVVTCEDTHGGNILFDGSGNVSGFVDFELTVLSEVERSMRFLCFADNPKVLEHCIDAYNKANGITGTEAAVTIDRVLFLARFSTVNALCRQLDAGVPNPMWFTTHAARLMRVYPDQDWRELAGAITQNYAPPEGEDWKMHGRAFMNARGGGQKQMTPVDELNTACLGTLLDRHEQERRARLRYARQTP